MLCNALKQPLSLQSSSQNLLLVSSLPVFRNRNQRNLNLPYHRSSARNCFASREEGKTGNKQLSLLISSLASEELKLNIRIFNYRKCKWLDQRTHQEICLTRSRRRSSKWKVKLKTLRVSLHWGIKPIVTILIYWNKRKFLHKKRVQHPQGQFGRVPERRI